MGSRAEGRKRKRAIIEAAMELYAKDGTQGTGLIAVGKAAGVTHQAVSYHFGTKDALVQEVLLERDRRVATELAEYFSQGGLDALRQLPKVAEFNLANPGLMRLHIVVEAENLRPEHPAHEFFLERRRAVRDFVAAGIRHGQRKGEIREDVDPELKAEEINAFMQGAALQWLIDPDQVDLVALFESYSRALVADLAVDGAATGS